MRTLPVVQIAGLLLTAVTIYLVFSQADTMLKYWAVDGCAKSATKTVDSGVNRVTETDQWFYRFCLEDKGYQTTLPR